MFFSDTTEHFPVTPAGVDQNDRYEHRRNPGHQVQRHLAGCRIPHGQAGIHHRAGRHHKWEHSDTRRQNNAGQVNDRGVDDILAQVKQIVGDMPVYLTFDIDCLDPAFAPGTGTPVIGGLTSDRAIKLVRGLKDLNIVGMDVVEVAPAYDQSEITALAAATLALEMLYIQAAKKGE